MSTARTVFRKLRKLGTFWVAPRTLAHLEKLRLAELSEALLQVPKGGRLLEIGAGTGWQAQQLVRCGYDVSAVDLAVSNYAADRVFAVTDYDGHHLPFADAEFDIIFSSNVLEHIPHVEAFQQEILRVAKPGACVVHVVPSGSWRIWTNLTEMLSRWILPGRHGEHAANAWNEIAYFSRKHWRRLFEQHGWMVVEVRSNRLFYTGCSIMDARIGIGARRRMAAFLGGSCHIFVLKCAGK